MTADPAAGAFAPPALVEGETHAAAPPMALGHGCNGREGYALGSQLGFAVPLGGSAQSHGIALCDKRGSAENSCRAYTRPA